MGTLGPLGHVGGLGGYFKFGDHGELESTGRFGVYSSETGAKLTV